MKKKLQGKGGAGRELLGKRDYSLTTGGLKREFGGYTWHSWHRRKKGKTAIRIYTTALKGKSNVVPELKKELGIPEWTERETSNRNHHQTQGHPEVATAR